MCPVQHTRPLYRCVTNNAFNSTEFLSMIRVTEQRSFISIFSLFFSRLEWHTAAQIHTHTCSGHRVDCCSCVFHMNVYLGKCECELMYYLRYTTYRSSVAGFFPSAVCVCYSTEQLPVGFHWKNERRLFELPNVYGVSVDLKEKSDPERRKTEQEVEEYNRRSMEIKVRKQKKQIKRTTTTTTEIILIYTLTHSNQTDHKYTNTHTHMRSSLTCVHWILLLLCVRFCFFFCLVFYFLSIASEYFLTLYV